MNPDLFEEITNAIAIIIKDDAAISAYSVENTGSVLTPQDNSIGINIHIQNYPYFVIVKGEEEHFFNRGTAQGLKNTLPLTIVFYGQFKGDQVSDYEFALPEGAKITVNDILTYTPSDIMRKIARSSAKAINEKIDCIIPQLRVEQASIFSEGYYDSESGVVGAILNITLYQENNGYNN